MSWEIIGYHGASEICRIGVSGRYREKRVSEILRRLVCRDLECQEVIDGSIGHSELLKVYRDNAGGVLMLRCGDNPHYLANWITQKE